MYPFAIFRLNSLLKYEKNLIKYIEEKEKVSEEGCLYGSWEEGGNCIVGRESRVVVQYFKWN